MREQKYARVLEEYEKKLKEQEQAQKEVVSEDTSLDEDVSMTREIKYKELQDVIDNDSNTDSKEVDVDETTSKLEQIKEDIAEVEDILEKTDHLQALEKMAQEEKKDEEDTKDEPKKEDDKVKIEQVSGKSDLDDIYLTTSFKPLRKRFRVSKLLKKIITTVLIIAIFIGVGYFGVYPLLQKYVFNSPKRIFENSIDYVVDLVNKTIPTEDKDNKEIESFLYNYNLDFKTNLEGAEFLNDYDYQLDIGSDFKQNTLLVDASMSKGNDKVGFQTYFKDKKSFVKFSTDDNYMLIDEDGEDIKSWEMGDIFNSFNQLSTSDIKYYITGELKIMKSLLDDKYLSKDKDEITIDGKSVKVTRNTLKLDQETAIEIEKKFYEKLKEDKKLLEIYATLNDYTVSEAEDFIDHIDYEETYDEKYDAAINIYTTKGNEFAGIDYEENGFRLAYYYRNDYEFDLYLNLTDDEVCKEGMDCNVDDKMVFQINGETKDKITEVVIKYNNKKIATLNVREFKDDKIDFDYEINFQNVNFDGFVKIEKKDENINFDIKMNFSDYYFEMIIDLKEKYNCDIPKINKEDYVDASDKELQNRTEKVMKKLDEMGVLKLIDDLTKENGPVVNNNQNAKVANVI